MSTQHTPEPWHVEAERHDYFIVASGKPIAEIFSPFGNDSADARRIVACVNACTGINPKAVPDLLAALEFACEQFDGPGLHADQKDAVAAMQAAIAKAKGGTL